MEGVVTVEEAAKILEVNPDRIRKLCRQKRLECKKFGFVWMVDLASVQTYKDSYRKPGPKPGREGD